MRIAVIADTHDEVPSALPGRLREADEIWHLGDVCTPDVLASVNPHGRPLWVVRGNGDFHSDWPESLVLEREGQRFLLVHIPPMRVPLGIEVVLHGHTHFPRDEVDLLGIRWLNPGAITGPRGGSRAGFAWLTIESGRPFEWRWTDLRRARDLLPGAGRSE